MDAFFLDHLQDLAERSRAQDRFTFSDFLNMEEQSILLQHKKTLSPFTLYGGVEGAERQMARFGNEETLGYSEDFPIVCLHLAPKNQKFADKLTHRDFLGTLMGTGIERGQVGDIILRENAAYFFVNEKIVPWLCEELKTVKHTAVRCERCEEVPAGALFTTEPKQCIAASPRLDCILGAVWRMSRNEAGSQIASQKVFINGALCESTSHTLKPGDIVSARGCGKFVFAGVTGETKKGRITFTAEIYK